MLSSEFHSFYAKWNAKATAYNGDDLQSAFDRFFTLFVIYNRLYAEVTFYLAREGKINLSKRKNFPDGNAATDYVMQFLGSSRVIDFFESDASSAQALEDVDRLLDGPMPDGKQFAIKLDMIHGEPQRGADLELLRMFRSNSRNERGTAVLEFIYAVRCNLFHGHKGFDPIQIEVMRPANVLLARIIDTLFARLNAL